MGLTQRLGLLADVFQPDSSLNVGIGGAANSSYKLTVTGATLTTGAATFSSSVTAVSGNIVINADANYAGYSAIGFNGNVSNGSAKIFTANNGSDAIYYAAATSQGHTFRVNGSTTAESVKFLSNGNVILGNSGGNVGIGTTSPINALDVRISSSTAYSSNSAGNVLTLYNTSTTTGAYAGIDFISEPTSGNAGRAAINLVVTGSGTGNLCFSTRNGTLEERMRITNSGKVEIGSTSSTYSDRLGVSTNTLGPAVFFTNTRNVSGDTCMYMRMGDNARNTTSYYLQCFDTIDNLYIYGNGNVVNRNNSYGTLSDVNLKENIVDATPKLDDLLQLKVRNFNLIGDDTKQIGFIAQEFEEIFPAMIDIDGKSGMKTIKTSVLVPMLVKAIQELKAEIEELKNR